VDVRDEGMVYADEEIVKRYFELKGYFVMTDVKYLKRKERMGKKSSGYGDIDLIVINPTTGDKAIMAVSGWHTERITPSYAKYWEKRLFGLLDEDALEKSQSSVGHKKFPQDPDRLSARGKRG